MTQTYVLRNPEIAKRMVAQIKMLAGPANAAGRPLMVTVEEYSESRTSEQNKKLHAMLEEISESAWWDGRQYPMEFWKEYFRRLFLLKDEYVTPTGEIIQVYWSTADLKKKPFAEFLTKVEVHAIEEFGVGFAAV